MWLFNAFGPPDSWNETRNYTPAVLYDPLKFGGHGASYYFKMWRTGRSAAGNYAIGLAFLPEFIPPPTGKNTAALTITAMLAMSSGIALRRYSRKLTGG